MVTKVQKGYQRPAGYRYFEIMREHLGGDLSKIFNGELVYPRQLEIHLPGDHEHACNFRCFYCQGRKLNQSLGDYEDDALKLVRELNGKIPFMIYGGAYTEPLLNPSFPEFIKATKETGANFGIHTNGSLLLQREYTEGFVSMICEKATSTEDYLSISLDAGSTESHCKIKGLKFDWFTKIIEGIRIAVKKRGFAPFPSIRVVYLLTNANSSRSEIEGICRLMKELGVDSLRFSIPYDHYGKDFDKVVNYKRAVEVRGSPKFTNLLNYVLTNDNTSRPQIFYIGPECQDVEKMTFRQCIYGYYQITLGADGYVYKCSSVATPSFSRCRLGKVPSSVLDLNKMILDNYDPDFNASVCFRMGARCNRMALEINTSWERINGKN